MSADRPDDFDEIPSPPPLPPDLPRRRSPADDDGWGPLPERRPRRPEVPRPNYGFGFWRAVLWCLLFLLVTQLLALIVCGLPIATVFLGIEIAQNGMDALKDEEQQKAWTQGPNGRLMTLSILIASQLVGILFGWLILRWRLGRPWKRRIALARRPATTHWLLIVIGMPAVLALSAALEQPIMRYVPSIQDLLNRANIDFEWPGIEAVEPLLKKAPFALAFFAVGVMPAVNEEFWCRGFLARGLAGRYPTWAVMLMTSFLFGAIHLEPRQGLWAMFFGAVMYGAYVVTRSLWAPMLIHFVNNGLAVITSSEQINRPVLKPLEEVLERSPALLVFSAALLFGAVVYALYQTRCKLVSVDPRPAWEPPGVSTMELPPPNSGTVVAHDRLSLVSVALVLVGAVAFGLVLSLA